MAPLSFIVDAHSELCALCFCYLPRCAAVLAEHVDCGDNEVNFYHNLQRRVCATSAQKGKVDSLNENIAKANGGGAPSPKSASGLD